MKQKQEEMQQEIEQAHSDKQQLIEAIFQKDSIIKEYQSKLKQLMVLETTKVAAATEPQAVSITEMTENAVQTDVATEVASEERLAELSRVNTQLQQKLFSTQEDLFDANNKVKLLTQEFAAFKALKQIEQVQLDE